MKNAVTVLGLMLLLVACSNKEEFSGNPIVEGWYADPEGFWRLAKGNAGHPSGL